MLDAMQARYDDADTVDHVRDTGRSPRPGLGLLRAETVAILFADISGSTALYRSLGDAEALRLVGRCLDGLGVAATAAGGTVVRSKGDDVLCTFTSVEAALGAARAMVEGDRGREVRMRSAVTHGVVLHSRGDLFGDAVNRAAHLPRLAKANEILVSGEAHARLAPAERLGLRRLGRHALKGHDAPVTMYALLPLDDAADSTVAATGSRMITLNEQGGTVHLGRTVRLRHGARVTLARPGRPISIGRAPDCDILVPSPWVSRQHATPTVTGGKALLIDHSSTGTLVGLADGQCFSVRRETVVLAGTGMLWPGSDGSVGPGEAIAFDTGTGATRG